MTADQVLAFPYSLECGGIDACCAVAAEMDIDSARLDCRGGGGVAVYWISLGSGLSQ